MNDNYKYFAFISYSRKDSRVAKWLQHRLEWFRFPLKLVPDEYRPPDSKYIRPVYRDKTSLEVDHGHYWYNIKNAIDESRFMIVLCSPHAARSAPVDKEIRYFLENTSREAALDHVIPVVLQGNVGTRDEEECLCPVLLERGSLITNRNLPTMLPDGEGSEKDGWENGFIGVASFLLRLNRESLFDHNQREKRKRANRIRIVAILFALLALFSVGMGIFAWVKQERAGKEEQLRRRFSYLKSVSEAQSLLSRGRPDLAKEALWATPETLRDWEWGHLLLKADPVLLMFNAASEKLWSMRFSDDGMRILTSSKDGDVKVWDATTGQKLLSLEGVEGRFTRDSRRIITRLNNGREKVWDVYSGRLTGTTEARAFSNGNP